MKVKILCEFEVTSDEEDELTEDVAKAAAEQAAFDYLAFVMVSGRNTDVDSVKVHVDGFGKCDVSIGEEHGEGL